MTKKTFALLLVGALSWAASARAQKLPTPVTVGAERMELLLPTLQDKRVALMVNQSSLVGSTGTHLVDTMVFVARSMQGRMYVAAWTRRRDFP